MSESETYFLEQIPAYALGILSPEEAQIVERHLETCTSCQEELRKYETLNADLALAVPTVEPPPNLEKRLMNRVASPPAPATSWWTGLREVWNQVRARPAWAAATMLALLLMLFLLWPETGTWERVDTFPAFALAGTEAAPGASGMIVSSEDGLHGTLIVQQLPTLNEEEQTYQLWLIRDGTWEDGGTLNVDEDGYGARYARADHLLTSYETFAVTVEPVEGSRTPTGTLVLHADP